MQLSYSDSLIQQVHDALLSNHPDLPQLQLLLEKNSSLSPEDAQKALYQVVLQLNTALFPPITKLELILTEGCNLGCTYCFEKNMLGYKMMPLDVARAAVDLLFDYSQNERLLYITHFGGEPTLNFPAIKYVTEYAEHKASLLGKSIDFNTTSNGVLLTEAMVDYFAKHKIKVLLSIDGLESTHNRFRIDKFGKGTFEQVMKGFKILKRKQPWIGVKMTVMPPNVPNLFDDVLGLYDMGVNQFIIGYATGIKWPEEDMIAYNDQLKKIYQWYKQKPRDDLRIDEFDDVENNSFFGCQAGRVSMTVTINGEISPCSKVLALNNKQLLAKLGDIRYGLSYVHNRFDLVSCSKLQSACEAHRIAEEFQGGCFASNYEDNYDIFQPSIQDHKFSLLKRSACSGCAGCKH